MLRTGVAFVVVTVTLPLVAWVCGGDEPLRNLAIVASFTASASAVGVPVYVWFRRRGWLSWWQAVLAGGVIGLACALPFAFRDPRFLVFAVPVFVNIGAIHGWLFWAIALWRPRLDDGAGRYESSAYRPQVGHSTAT
jgi:hypothetical protein